MRNKLYSLISISTYINYILMLTLSNNSEYSSYSRSFFILYFVLIFFYLLMNRFNLNRNVKIFFPFIVITVTSNLWAVSISQSIHRTIGIIYYLLQGLIFYELLSLGILKLKDADNIISISITTITLSAVYEYIFQGVRRAAGLLENANEYALTILFLSMLLVIIRELENKNSKYVYFPIIISIVISGSRKMLLALLLITLFFIVLYIVQKIKTNRLSVKKILTILSIISFILIFRDKLMAFISRKENVFVIERLTSDLKDYSYQVRTEMMREGITLIKDRLLIGYGLESFAFLSRFQTYSHNNYIELLVSYGVLGLISYYTIYFSIAVKNINRNHKSQKAANIIVMFIIVLIALEPAFVSFHTTNIWFLLSTLLYLTEFNIKKCGGVI